MKGYATDGADAAFTPRHLALRDEAQRIVALLPDEPLDLPREQLRSCHVVARVVARFTGLPVIDGAYGAMPHSWLGLEPAQPDEPYAETVKRNVWKLLDVYAPGRIPMVQLVECSSVLLPERSGYIPGPPLDEVSQREVEELVQIVRRRMQEQDAQRQYSAPDRRPATPVAALTATLRLLAEHTLGLEAGRKLEYDPTCEFELDPQVEGEVLPGGWSCGGYLIAALVAQVPGEELFVRTFVLYSVVSSGYSREAPPDYDTVELARGSETDIFAAIHRERLTNALQAMHEVWMHYQLEDAATDLDNPGFTQP